MLIRISEWRELARDHRHRVEQLTNRVRARRANGVKHPVEDFLFEYYRYPMSRLERWQPGYGTILEWSSSTESSLGESLRHLLVAPYRIVGKGLSANVEELRDREKSHISNSLAILEATAQRAPCFNCHGLHEWAMLYRGAHDRHAGTAPLRVAPSEIDRLVETQPLKCSHFDAYRFFAPEALRLNRAVLSRASRFSHEQPGCLHTNMDLYKWAAKASPWTGSELLWDCFLLAREIRDLDLRASPYDLSAWGREAVKVETPAGRAEYARQQQIFARRSAALRERLIDVFRAIQAASHSDSASSSNAR